MFLEAFAIAFEQGAADVFAFEGKAAGLDGKVGADGESHQIDGVGHGPGFVEVVDTPDEAALDVTPGAEILDVEIADRKDVRSLGEFGTDLGPELGPAEVSCAEEGEKFRLHAGVFEAEVVLIEVSALGQPAFEVAGGFDDVHAGNDSDGEKGKSNFGLRALGSGLWASGFGFSFRIVLKGLSPRRHGDTEKTQKQQRKNFLCGCVSVVKGLGATWQMEDGAGRWYRLHDFDSTAGAGSETPKRNAGSVLEEGGVALDERLFLLGNVVDCEDRI